MRIADTSFLYALFSETDDFHARALEAVRSPDALVIPSEIFSETVSLIQYRQGHAAARAAGEWLRQQGRIELGVPSPRRLETAWETFVASRGSLSYPDSIVLAWCEGRNVSPLAFDAALMRSWRERTREGAHRQPS